MRGGERVNSGEVREVGEGTPFRLWAEAQVRKSF